MVKRATTPGKTAPVALATQPSQLGTDAEVLRRLLDRGTKSLSDEELLSVLIRPGECGRSGLTCAQELLASCGGVPGLLTCDLSTVRAQALADTQAAAVLAAVELGRRLAVLPERVAPLEDSALAARYLYLNFSRSHQEVLGALLLDDFHCPISAVEIFRGLRRQLVAIPQPILREALRRNASAVLLFHTRPSGDPTPSQGDWKMTERFRQACELLGIELVDHLVLGGDRWLSMRRLKPW